MISNTLTPAMQRRFLLLARYLQALEADELEIAGKILQAAEQDEVLERMIMEANALYQITPSGKNSPANQAEADQQLVTSYLAQLEAANAQHNPRQTQPISRSPLPIARSHREQGRRQMPRLISVLAAALLGIILVGGFLTFLHISRGTSPSGPAAGSPPEKRLILVDGWRLEQIAQHAAQLGLNNFHVQEFLNYTHHPALFPDAAHYPMLQHAPSMEGLLYPTTYQIPARANTVQVIDIMLNTFTQVLQQNNLVALAQQHQLSAYQMITLASIVQREVPDVKDMRLVAGIYWNRAIRPNAETAGYLASDPTVEYARDTDTPPANSHYWVNLNDSGIGTTVAPASPWNTYTHKGWPPTPISSPGLDAMKAAASPAPTNCYYFLFKPGDGSVVCAQTLAQFHQLIHESLGQ